MTPDLPLVLGLALLPALGNFSGGLLAELLDPSPTVLNRALHAATGVILAVVAVEVMPRALATTSAWVLALALLAGGVAYVALEVLVHRWQQRKAEGIGTGAWMIYGAVAADLFGDGLLIGAGTAVSATLGLLLAVGQVLADVPEGCAVVANFREKGVSRPRRLLLSASFAIPVMVGALLAHLILRGQGGDLKMPALVFTAGLYLLAAVEHMLREAHERGDDSPWSAISLIAGFAFFLALSGRLD